MAILSREGGTGPYRREKRGGVPGKALVLTPVERATNESGDELPVPAWQTRIVRAERAALAIPRFQPGKAALVLGGRFSHLPLLVPGDRKGVVSGKGVAIRVDLGGWLLI